MPVFTHAACLAHDTGPTHAECAQRLSAVTSALRECYADLDWREAPKATRGQLLRVHEAALLHAVLETRHADAIWLDPDTVLSPASAEAGLRAAGAVVAAVELVMNGEAERAFCAVRPPGHHATRETAMGFCLFNNIAVGAAHALDKYGLSRIAIADFDVHHGNGTQAIFQDEARVVFASSHQMPLYPDSGYVHERGIGNIFNAPLPPRTDGTGFREAWRERLLPQIDAFRPQLVMISAGFDAHQRDPLAQLRLEADDFAWITAALIEIAARHADGRVVSSLEGGYDMEGLRESSIAHVAALRA
ncbi:MAG: histone deacetylase family protein [Lysobacteraceae bacterium]|nr:MAG: histone deacetylase family protein [Xanthomonadaceae bacterium]